MVFFAVMVLFSSEVEPERCFWRLNTKSEIDDIWGACTVQILDTCDRKDKECQSTDYHSHTDEFLAAVRHSDTPQFKYPKRNLAEDWVLCAMKDEDLADEVRWDIASLYILV